MSELPYQSASEVERAGVEIYECFRTHDELSRFVEGLGLTPDVPKHVLSAFRESLIDVVWRLEGEARIAAGRSVTSVLEDVADANALFLDEPNDFTVGLVLATPDGRKLAIRYRSEECEILGSMEDLDDLERERELEIIREFEAVVCADPSKLLWTGDSLAER